MSSISAIEELLNVYDWVHRKTQPGTSSESSMSWDISMRCVCRLNKCGVISPRYDVKSTELEAWVARLLPSRLVRFASSKTATPLTDCFCCYAVHTLFLLWKSQSDAWQCHPRSSRSLPTRDFAIKFEVTSSEKSHIFCSYTITLHGSSLQSWDAKEEDTDVWWKAIWLCPTPDEQPFGSVPPLLTASLK